MSKQDARVSSGPEVRGLPRVLHGHPGATSFVPTGAVQLQSTGASWALSAPLAVAAATAAAVHAASLSGAYGCDEAGADAVLALLVFKKKGK